MSQKKRANEVAKAKTSKKLVEMKNVLVAQEKNSSIAMEAFNYIFLKALRAFNLAAS